MRVSAAVYGLLVLILFFAASVRVLTFWLPHWQGDQSQYVSLAMKLHETPALSGYNLRAVEVRLLSMKEPKGLQLVYPRYKRGDETGDLIRVYRQAGFDYYDMPLFYKAPLWPATLSFAHSMIAPKGHPFSVVKSNLDRRVFRERPETFFRAQFWAAVVPYVLSLLVITITFFFGRELFGRAAGLYAAGILAMNPVSILTAHRLWTEDLMTLLITVSLFVFWRSYRRQITIGAFFAGTLMGFGALTNQKVLLMLPVVAALTILDHKRPLHEWRAWHRIAFNRFLLWFIAGLLVICGFWFLAVNRRYGSPFWQPKMETDASMANDWVTLLRSRPRAWIIYLIGAPCICPPLFAFYATLKTLAVDTWRMLAKRARISPVVFLWLWVLPTLIYYVSEGRGMAGEHRYLFPVYPALAMLAGAMLGRLHFWIGKFFRRPAVGYVLFSAVFASCAFLSVPIGVITALEERNLIIVPF